MAKLHKNLYAGNNDIFIIDRISFLTLNICLYYSLNMTLSTQGYIMFYYNQGFCELMCFKNWRFYICNITYFQQKKMNRVVLKLFNDHQRNNGLTYILLHKLKWEHVFVRFIKNISWLLLHEIWNEFDDSLWMYAI